MTHWKKLLALMLSLVLVAGMAACSGGAASSDAAAPADEPADAPATEESAGEDAAEGSTGSAGAIEFWNDKMAETDPTITESLAAAITEDSDVGVTIVGYPDVAAYQTAMQQSISEASAPGMFTWWNGPQLETLANNDLLVDLTDEWEQYYIPAGVSPDVADALTVDGKIVAAPYGVLNNTIIYNKRVFEKAGVEIPTTFAEFQDACQKILDAGSTPIGLKDDSWASFIWFQQFLAAYDPAIYTGVCDGSLPYTDAKVVEVMEMWRGMIDSGYFSLPVKNTDMYKAFANDEVAMILEPPLAVPNLTRDFALKSGEDFGAFVLPSVDSDKSVIFFEVSPLCIPTATADVDAAKAAVRGFLSSGAQDVMANQMGMPATATAPIEDATIAEMSGFSAEQDKYTLILRYYENTPAELRDFALDELSRFMYSGADINEVLASIQAKADEVFGAA